MKKVLIITYYWPPSGGSGVQRWVYFAKYLRDFGWEPIIYTMKNPNYQIIDNDLEKTLPENITVLKESGFEPHQIYKLLTKQKDKDIPNNLSAKNNNGFLHQLSVWVRGNIFIPDARKFWIKPSVNYLTNYLKNNTINAIVSTSPPQSTHIIALKLHRKFNIPWLADFRDPWTKITYFNDLHLSNYARKKHYKLEKEVVTSANVLTTVTPGWQMDFEEIRGKKVELITNGYDEDINFPESSDNLSTSFNIGYFGVLSYDRNPQNLWKAIEEMYNNDEAFAKQFKLTFAGSIDNNIQKELKKYSFYSKIIFQGIIPHQDVIKEIVKCNILLVIGIPKDKRVLPAKTFEYFSSKKPILSIGENQSDTSDFLTQNQCGLNADFNDFATTLKHLKQLWEWHQKGELFQQFNFSDENISKYSRKNITKKLSELLNNMIEEK